MDDEMMTPSAPGASAAASQRSEDEEECFILDDMAAVYCRAAREHMRKRDWKQAAIVLLNQLRKHDMALQSLTPGGSEYVGNPDLCVHRARESRDRYRDLWQEAIRQLRIQPAAAAERPVAGRVTPHPVAPNTQEEGT